MDSVFTAFLNLHRLFPDRHRYPAMSIRCLISEDHESGSPPSPFEKLRDTGKEANFPLQKTREGQILIRYRGRSLT